MIFNGVSPVCYPQGTLWGIPNILKITIMSYRDHQGLKFCLKYILYRSIGINALLYPYAETPDLSLNAVVSILFLLNLVNL